MKCLACLTEVELSMYSDSSHHLVTQELCHLAASPLGEGEIHY